MAILRQRTITRATCHNWLTADLSPMTIGASATDIVGKAVIVHKDADDFKTQPTGNSGARVACGVIAKS